MDKERLQKILSKSGYGSRRDCEKLIANKRVTVNGDVATLGDKGDIERDVIEVDGKPIKTLRKKNIYIAVNKPREVLSEIKKVDERKTVIDLVNVKAYLFIVGRLDYMSEGLILLTNDGDLANKLSHPRFEHEKEYLVQVNGEPNNKQLNTWREGVVLENGYKTLPANVKVDNPHNGNTRMKVILKEGKKRQIREVGKKLGLPVRRIKRIRIGTLRLGNLKPGEWRYLEKKEIEKLKKSCS